MKTRAKLPDVVWFQEGPGVRKYQYRETGIKLLNVANLVDGKVDLSTSSRYISTEEAYGKYKHFLVDDGDLIIASSGIQVSYFDKKMGFANKSHLPLCMNTSTIRFKTKDSSVLDIHYFMYFLKSYSFKGQLAKQITGSAQLNFGPSHLQRMTISFPLIQEQEKIVAELDCLTSIIDKRKQQLEELDKLAQSIFYEMFGNSEYQKAQLISLCADKDDIKCGPFGTQLSKREFLKDGVPVWGIPQVNSNFAIPPTDFVSEEKATALQSFSIIGGDIVMSRKGNIGQSAIFPTSFESGILHSDVLRIRVKRELANPLYLVYQFHQSVEIKHQFRIIGYGAIMPGLNVSKLKSVIVDIPPISLQNEFAKRIEAIETQKELVKRSIVETETLFNSRMDYWFN